MSCVAMQHLECAALGIEIGSAHPEEHTAAGELGIQEGPRGQAHHWENSPNRCCTAMSAVHRLAAK